VDASKLGDVEIDEKQIARQMSIIKSMTKKERENPSILNSSRRKRIAKGSGTSVQEVNRLLNQFEQSRKLMKQLSGGAFGRKKKGRKGFRFPF